MSNPTSSQLPDLCQATLDWPGVESLLRDIEACARIDEIIPKSGPRNLVSDSASCTLEEARDLLRNRLIRGIQIRYHYDNADWWDSLLTLPDGYRLVRIRQA